MLGYLHPLALKVDFMLFAAYLDGSGKLHNQNSDHVVLAGAVFYGDRVGEFGPQWTERLKTHSQAAKRPIVPFLHTTEALRSDGHFKGWELPQVLTLLEDLATLTRDHSYKLISAPANKTSFKNLPSDFQKKLQGPNELSFEICINDLVDDLGRHDQLHIACDDEENESIKMYKFLVRYKLRYPQRRDKFVGLCFADDRFHPALQAADLLAYVVREEFDRRTTGTSPDSSSLYRVFTANGKESIEYGWAPGGDGLGSAERLRR